VPSSAAAVKDGPSSCHHYRIETSGLAYCLQGPLNRLAVVDSAAVSYDFSQPRNQGVVIP
jgi:hypothetical protein